MSIHPRLIPCGNLIDILMCPQVADAVLLAVAHPAALGARVTGAGFAGCAVALIHREGLDSFVGGVSAAYNSLTGDRARLYPMGAAGGVALA